MKSLKVVFMGTPEFSLPGLQSIYKNFNLIGCFTQPSRPAGRGQKISHSPVKNFCTKNNVPVFTPNNFKEDVEINHFKKMNCDVLVVAAYGIILPEEILSIPKFGALNIHASLLPRWRGAAPIQRAILAGDKKTGITIMQMDAGMDTGPLLAQQEISIRSDHTTGTLTTSLEILGANLIQRTLPGYIAGTIHPILQNPTLVTYAPMMRKAFGHLSFDKTAAELERKIRAMTPWPGAFVILGEKRIKILQAQAISGSGQPGKTMLLNKNIVVGTGDGLLKLQQIQAPGKRPMQTTDYVRGFKAFVVSVLE